MLNHADQLTQLDYFYISSITLEELENIKISSRKDEGVKFQARQVVRYLKKNQDRFTTIPVMEKHQNIVASKKLKESPDNLIVATAYSESLGSDLVFITEDLLCEIFAKDIFGLEVDSNYFKNGSEEDYKGYKEFLIDTNNEEDSIELARLYEEPYENIYNLLTNEYLIIRDKAIPIYDEDYEQVIEYKVVDTLKWDGFNYVKINTNPFSSLSMGRIKYLDVYQSLAFDSLRSNQFTEIRGSAGSGKTLIGLSYAMNMIESGKFSKLIVFTNPVNTINSARLGFYKGSRDEKLLDSSTGLMLGCKFGGKSNLQELIDKNKIELLPFSDLRGYDTSGMNAIIYVLEAQNLDIELLKLAIQRVSDDCKLILDGDYHTQTDMRIYEGANNGMRRASEVFRGKDVYGEIEFQKIFRSEIAEIASLM